MSHAETIERGLQDIERVTRSISESVRVAYPSDTSMCAVDLALLGVLKRVLSVSRGFRVLVGDRNFLCSAALVRMQLDCALRFSGILLTDDPNDAAKRLIGGERIDRMRDRDGKRMRDHHLVSKLSGSIPWVQKVYDEASAYVHLSTTHLFAPVADVREGGGEVTMLFTDQDVCAPNEKWREMVVTFREVTRLAGGVLGMHMNHRGKEPSDG